MKKISLILTLFFVSCSMSQAMSPSAPFLIKSSSLEDGVMIPNKHVYNSFGCSGKNLSPQIAWQNAPLETKSFAVTVYDPDAPTGSGWWHWLVLNIPTKYKELPQNFGEKNQFNLADGVMQVRNDFGAFNFGGPCPPIKDKPHRYVFTVYALRAERLDLSEGATGALAGFMINQSVLAKASFTAYYGR